MSEFVTKIEPLRVIYDKDKIQQFYDFMAEQREANQREFEENIVARLLANRELAYDFQVPELAYLHRGCLWQSQTLYHAFMMILNSVVEDMPETWGAKLRAIGVGILKEENDGARR